MIFDGNLGQGQKVYALVTQITAKAKPRTFCRFVSPHSRTVGVCARPSDRNKYEQKDKVKAVSRRTELVSVQQALRSFASAFLVDRQGDEARGTSDSRHRLTI